MTRLLSLTLLLFLIPLTSFGATTLVPTGCQAGCPCTLCDFYLLAHNIITILFELMAIIAVLSFLYGGILIMTSGGSEGKVKQGKDAITSAVIGALIAGLAWLFFSAALNSLTFGIKTVTLDGFFKPLACNTGGGESCNTTFKPKPPPDPAIARLMQEMDQGTFRNGFDTSDPAFARCQGTEAASCSWKGAGVPPDPNAVNNVINNYKDEIIAALGANATPENIAAVAAIMATESGGRPNVSSPANAHGLMQMIPSTARLVDPSLRGMSDAQIAAKLKSDPAYAVTLGTQHYMALQNKYGPDLAAAAYNGGEGALRKSRTCPGQMYWECEANAGYRETRNYVAKVKGARDEVRRRLGTT